MQYLFSGIFRDSVKYLELFQKSIEGHCYWRDLRPEAAALYQNRPTSGGLLRCSHTHTRAAINQFGVWACNQCSVLARYDIHFQQITSLHYNILICIDPSLFVPVSYSHPKMLPLATHTTLLYNYVRSDFSPSPSSVLPDPLILTLQYIESLAS